MLESKHKYTSNDAFLILTSNITVGIELLSIDLITRYLYANVYIQTTRCNLDIDVNTQESRLNPDV